MKYLVFIITILSILACKKEIETNVYKFPLFELNEVVQKDGSIHLSATIVRDGSDTLIEYGFMYRDEFSEVEFKKGNLPVIPAKIENNEIKASTDSLLMKGVRYTFKAYCRIKNYTIFSNSVEIYCEGTSKQKWEKIDFVLESKPNCIFKTNNKSFILCSNNMFYEFSGNTVTKKQSFPSTLSTYSKFTASHSKIYYYTNGNGLYCYDLDTEKWDLLPNSKITDYFSFLFVYNNTCHYYYAINKSFSYINNEWKNTTIEFSFSTLNYISFISENNLLYLIGTDGFHKIIIEPFHDYYYIYPKNVSLSKPYQSFIYNNKTYILDKFSIKHYNENTKQWQSSNSPFFIHNYITFAFSDNSNAYIVYEYGDLSYLFFCNKLE